MNQELNEFENQKEIQADNSIASVHDKMTISQLEKLLDSHNNAALEKEVAESDPHNVADALIELSEEKILIFFKSLPSDISADVFTCLSQDDKEKVDTTLYVYLDEHQRAPWWGAIISAPFKVLGWTISLFKDDEVEGTGTLDPFRLTKDEADIAEALSKRIAVSVDKKTGVTTLTVTMQDPLISASLTDTVMHRLQNYITEYRTNKARHDLAFTEKLYTEAKANYTDAQSKYASFVDANQNIILLSYRAEQERLQNEMSLAYNVYTQVAQQLQMAKAKVQEITPVYTVVQPATVPLRPSKPSKPMILIGFVFLAGVGSVGWILFIKDLLKGWKKQTTI